MTTRKSNSTPNRLESRYFLKTAMAWNGSVTPVVLPRVLWVVAYSVVVGAIASRFDAFGVTITPFEYSGVVLGALLVLRVNQGLDRWWEARKLWGSIVNQSRNLAIIGAGYSAGESETLREYVRWVAAWPHVIRESLRGENTLVEVRKLVGTRAEAVRLAGHMPSYVGLQITIALRSLREQGLDDFAFYAAERERAGVVDSFGACERILNTPLPFVLAIKVRRFLLLFLLLMPVALFERLQWWAPFIVALASYPLFSLDEIGAELQNPFDSRHLSHLPLNTICEKIQADVMEIVESATAARG